jgi:hypothetical protein
MKLIISIFAFAVLVSAPYAKEPGDDGGEPDQNRVVTPVKKKKKGPAPKRKDLPAEKKLEDALEKVQTAFAEHQRLLEKFRKDPQSLTEDERSLLNKKLGSSVKWGSRSIISLWTDQWYEKYKHRYDPSLMSRDDFRTIFKETWIWIVNPDHGKSWNTFKKDSMKAGTPIRNFTEAEMKELIDIDTQYYAWAKGWKEGQARLEGELPADVFESILLMELRLTRGWKPEVSCKRYSRGHPDWTAGHNGQASRE